MSAISSQYPSSWLVAFQNILEGSWYPDRQDQKSVNYLHILFRHWKQNLYLQFQYFLFALSIIHCILLFVSLYFTILSMHGNLVGNVLEFIDTISCFCISFVAAQANTHINKIHFEASCRWPKPKVEKIQKDPSKKYFPHCTVLHRCGDDTGCCEDDLKTCVAMRTQAVDLYFTVSTRISNKSIYSVTI